MASVVDAIDETLHDENAVLKFIIYTIPVVGSYLLFFVGNMGWFYFVGFLTIMLLLTLLVKTINNVRNGRNQVLPDLNIFSMIGTSFKVLFALGPIFAIYIFIAIKLISIPITLAIPNIQIIYKIIVWLPILSMMITSIILFARHEKILDAYNLKVISNTCIDILIQVLYFLPQIILFNAIIVGIVAYLFFIFQMSVFNIYTVIVASYSLVMSVAITGNYLAQVDFEQIGRDEQQDDN